MFRELQCTVNLVSVFRVSDYRRKRVEPHISRELLRSDNAANNALMALAQRDAMLDCSAWLASGNSVAVSIHGMYLWQFSLRDYVRRETAIVDSACQ